MHFDFFKSTPRKSNQSIKEVTIYFLKPMVLSSLNLHFSTTRSPTFSRFNLALLGVSRSDLDEAAGTRKTTLTSLARKGKLRLVMICGRHLWLGCTCTQKTLCNGVIKIVSKVSPNFGCLFLRNNTVFLGWEAWLSVD